MADTMKESTLTTDIPLTALAARDLLEIKALMGSVFVRLSPAVIKFAAEIEKSTSAQRSFGDIYKTSETPVLMKQLEEDVEKLIKRHKEDGLSAELTKNAANVAVIAMYLALNAMEGRVL